MAGNLNAGFEQRVAHDQQLTMLWWNGGIEPDRLNGHPPFDSRKARIKIRAANSDAPSTIMAAPKAKPGND